VPEVFLRVREKASRLNAPLLLSVSSSAHRETSQRRGLLFGECQMRQSIRAVRRR
jgi:hypothetical protein